MLRAEQWRSATAVLVVAIAAVAGGYGQLLEKNGCTVVECDDLGDVWSRILEERLAMYRSLQSETERRFGTDRSREWDDAYSFFVSRYREDKLGGGRFIARRDRPPVSDDEQEGM